ncbi:hypothetical protein [Saccharothrix stipae]
MSTPQVWAGGHVGVAIDEVVPMHSQPDDRAQLGGARGGSGVGVRGADDPSEGDAVSAGEWQQAVMTASVGAQGCSAVEVAGVQQHGVVAAQQVLRSVGRPATMPVAVRPGADAIAMGGQLRRAEHVDGGDLELLVISSE